MSKCLFQPGGGGLSKSKLKAVTAKATDVLSGKVIVDKDGNPLTGTIESKDGQTITPTTAAQTVACNGKYMTGDIKVNGDSNLVAGNILSGKTIFGVAGTAQKFGHTKFAIAASSTSKVYDYYPNKTRSFYPATVNCGFKPIIYGYVCYTATSYNGIINNYGTFRTAVGSTQYDVLINGKLVSGTSLYLPCGTTGKKLDGGAAGYY